MLDISTINSSQMKKVPNVKKILAVINATYAVGKRRKFYC